MSEPVENDDEVYVRRKRSLPDTEIDITPMIDVTFQLLIFFMVTSTMQGNPPADLPPSKSGGSIEVAKVINVVVRPAAVSGGIAPKNRIGICRNRRKLTQILGKP